MSLSFKMRAIGQKYPLFGVGQTNRRVSRRDGARASANTDRYETLLAKTHNPQVLLCTGPAGTGKTMLACKHAVNHITNGSFERLIITRPNVSIEEELGFLPGTMEQKMSPWMIPLYEYLEKFTDRNTVRRQIGEGVIEILPLGFMRGRTFDNTIVIADEMQNSTNGQMINLLTRIGNESKLVLTGDLSQCDLNKDEVTNGLHVLIDKYDKYQGKDALGGKISHVEMSRDDIRRSDIVRIIVDMYDI